MDALTSSKGDELSHRGALALIEHLLALMKKEGDGPGEGNVPLRSFKSRPISYHNGLMSEWRSQIATATDTLDIDWNTRSVRYSAVYFRANVDWDPDYVAGQQAARSLTRAWVTRIKSEVAQNAKTTISRSRSGRIDYTAVPQLEALRYLQRVMGREFFDKREGGSAALDGRIPIPLHNGSR